MWATRRFDVYSPALDFGPGLLIRLGKGGRRLDRNPDSAVKGSMSASAIERQRTTGRSHLLPGLAASGPES
jgi:hypothetical protein